jgi:hypothetical protein
MCKNCEDHEGQEKMPGDEPEINVQTMKLMGGKGEARTNQEIPF